MFDVSSVIIHCSDACNMQCAYCYAGGHVSKDKFNPHAKEMVDFLYEFNHDYARDGKKKGYVSFMGGEPLLHKEEILKTVDYALTRYPDMHTRFSLTTNMVAADDAWIERWCGAGHHMHLSMDGCREAQDANRPLRGGRPSFDIADKNLRKILKAVPDKKTIRATLTPASAPFVVQSLDYFLSLGLTDIIMQPAICGGNNTWRQTNAGALMDTYDTIGKWMVDRAKEGVTAEVKPVTHFLESIRHKRPMGRAQCGIGSTLLTVDMNGLLIPCHQFICSDMSKYAVGSVVGANKRFDVEKINAMFNQSYTGRIARKCGGCPAFQAGCMLSCVHHALESDTEGANLHCALSRHLSQVALRVNAQIPDPRASTAACHCQ